MIKEYGIVIRTDQSKAWIKSNRTAACESCASKDNCGGHHGSKEMIFTVKNTLMVKKGDQVVVGVESKPMVFLAFLLYMFPIMCLVIGALIGDTLAPALSLNPSLSALIFGGFSFITAFSVIRISHSRLNKKEEYKPFLVKKIPLISQPCQAP